MENKISRRKFMQASSVAGAAALVPAFSFNSAKEELQNTLVTLNKNPMKIGKYTPGMHLPVLPVQALLDQQPDYALILAWNFADEIIKQQATYLERGGQFILPLPIPRIISGKKS